MSWEEVELGHICSPKQHKTIPTKDLTPEGYPVFGANGQIGFYPKYTHESETVAITCRGATCGTINVSPACAYITGNAMALDHLDNDRVHLRYLVYALRNRGLHDVISGSAQPQITRAPLLTIKIPLPPLDEQKRIAAILDQADALRRLRQRALDKLNTLGQAVFYEMFGDPISNEKGFAHRLVGDFVENFDTGKNIAADPDAETTAPFRVLKVSAVTSGFYKPEESKPLPLQYQPPPSHIVHDGDLLFSRANTSELIGATAFVETTPEGIALPDKLWRFRWSNSFPTKPLFVQYLFSSPAFRREITKRASGTSGSMKNISKPKVLSIETGMPPIEEQKIFATILRNLQGHLMQVTQQAVVFEALFASLQQRAFRGEL